MRPPPDTPSLAGVDLADWMALRDLEQPQLLERLGLGENDIATGVAYQGLRPVDRVDAEARHVYLRDGRVVMVYGAIDRPGADEFEQALGGPGHELRSRGGKRAVMHVYPEQGIAVSTKGSIVQFLEVFPPTTIDAYRDEIYVEPRPFIQ
jgi:hypothetical protein